MENEYEEKSKNNDIIIKTFIPCKFVYSYGEQGGIPPYNTCVEVFRRLIFFDFPSIPRSIYAFLIMDASKGSYEIGMNIVDETGNKIITETIQEINISKDHTSFDLTHFFRNVIFPKEGEYFFQLIVNNNVIYRYDFMALKMQKKELTPDEVKNILNDPDTIKFISFDLICNCGLSKKFSLALDPEKQKKEEKLPDENIIKCEGCGNDINIAEYKAHMNFYLGSKDLAGTFNKNLNESRVLAANGFLNSSLIMQVSAFEAYMRDSLKLNFKNWFIHLSDDKKDINENFKNIKNKIIKITDEMRLKDQFYDQIFLLGNYEYKTKLDETDNYNEALKKLIFGDDEEEQNTVKISFQQLKGNFGCFWAYKHFFGIDLKNELDKQKDKYIEDLLKNFGIRHRIIHGSSGNPLYEELNQDIIKKNEKIILFIKQLIMENFKKIDEKRKEIEGK